MKKLIMITLIFLLSACSVFKKQTGNVKTIYDPIWKLEGGYFNIFN